MVSPHLVHGKEYRDNRGLAQSVPKVSAHGQPDSFQVHTAYSQRVQSGNVNIETGNLLEAKEGRFDTFDSWGLELEFRRRGCFEHWDKKVQLA